MRIELSPEDLAVAHSAIGNAIVATEKVADRLATTAHAAMVPQDIFEELIGDCHKHVAALRRISDALLDAELESRFPA